MTIALANQATYANNAGTTGDSITIPSTTAGNLLVAVFGTKDFADNVTDVTGGGTWAEAVTTTGGGVSQRTQIWYVANVSSGITSISFTLAGSSRVCVWVGEWSGAATSSVLDVTAQAIGSSANPAPGSLTPSQANGVLVYGCQFANTNTLVLTRPLLFTAPASGNVESAAASASGTEIDVVYKIDPGTNPYNESWTLDASRNWGAAAAVFKEAGAATKAPPTLPPVYRYQHNLIR